MHSNYNVNRIVKKNLNEKTETIGGSFKTDLDNGPKNHGSRALGNWQSDNAWDVFAPPGSVVNSYTNGKVLKVKPSGKRSGKIYGTQVTVTGSDGYPDIFYTHLKNVKINAGDIINVGDRIGEVSEWDTNPKGTHVHIGLPRGKHLRDLLKNSSVIFSGKRSPENLENPKDFKDTIDSNKEDETKKVSHSKDDFDNLADFIKYLKTGKMPSSNIGNSLDDENSDEDSNDENNTENTNNNNDTSDDSKSTEIVNIKNYKISEPSSDDKDFYIKVLKKLNAPLSKQNLLFFYAWRQAEGAKAKYNPFNTTQFKEGSTLWNCLKKKKGICVGGVRNYKSKDDGIDATVKTITNGNYKCILDGLKNDKGAIKIAECSDLKTWGTGGGVKRVLNTKNIKPQSISSSEVKIVKESLIYEKERIFELIKKVL